MTWNELFPKENQPAMHDIAEYAGTFKPHWLNLIEYFETAYKCKPKMTYSCCGMKPGWNLKFQKSNTNFGTWYPKPEGFEAMFVWSYKFDDEMRMLIPVMTSKMAEHVQKAEDFMKNGRWIMFEADNGLIIEDYKRMCAVKKVPAA
ncbi:MAG: DUF3788 domain-containing protein [Defluviitaleaceae bacterium]|nr:DUF3788 domain-containing protein [Defluviitaleaceae bacterium]